MERVINLRREKNNKGITLIALVITIIVLLILATVSIATLTGENGVLTKANNAQKEADIAETKEQIKIELMGIYDDQNTDYTNQDVVNAIKKVTEKEVSENTAIIQSKKGNDVDISDLWKEKFVIYFPKLWSYGEHIEITFKKDQVWDKELVELLKNNPDTELSHSKGVHCSSTIWVYPDGFSTATLCYEGSYVHVGDKLINGAKYEWN